MTALIAMCALSAATTVLVAIDLHHRDHGPLWGRLADWCVPADALTGWRSNCAPRIVGYRCLRRPEGGLIPARALTDPCGRDVPVWSDGGVSLPSTPEGAPHA